MICRLFALPTLSLLLGLVLPACSSSDSGASKSKGNSTMTERMGKWDMSKRSSFESTTKTVKTDKKFHTGDNFRTKEYKGNTKFNTGKGELKQKSFAQSDKKSSMGDDTFSGADQQSRMGDTKFKTKQSRYNDQQNRNEGKVSSYDDDTFRTFENSMGRKGREESKRPYVEEYNSAAYTEDQVKGLLNKN